MAQAEGAHSAYDEPIGTGGNREDLSDILWDVSPTETPGITAIGKNRATAITHDWLTDSLEDPADNANIEGDDASPQAPASRIRLSNQTQIFKKHSVVTGTQERVLKGGGIKSEMAYQTGRRMKAIKRDAERAVFGVNNAKVAGSDVLARELGSFSSYMGDENGNVALPGSSYAGAGDGTAPAGDGTNVPTTGTPRALDETIFKAALETLWTQSGGNENIIALCGAAQRTAISAFTGAGTRYVTTDDKKLVDSIDVYDGDYHTVSVTPDRFCLTNAVFLLDPEYAKVSDLRPIHSYDLAKMGDSYRKEIVWEFTLEVCNPRAHIMIDALS
jgi:hypothetical protein